MPSLASLDLAAEMMMKKKEFLAGDFIS